MQDHRNARGIGKPAEEALRQRRTVDPGEARHLAIYLLNDDAHARRAWHRARNYTDRYAREILAHAGLPFTGVDGARLQETALAPGDVLVTGRWAWLGQSEAAAVRAFVERGGLWIAVGSPAGLDDVCGVRPLRVHGFEAPRFESGYLQPPSGAHSLARLYAGTPLDRPLQVCDVAPHEVTEAEVLAGCAGRPGDPPGPGICVAGRGEGAALFFAFDLFGSVLRIQQGYPVYADGPPAPDGTAAVDDGILKTDDGLVLDYATGRQTVAGEPMFATAVADRLREVFLQSIFWWMERREQPCPLVWYWPGEIEAVGHISHDTDHNDPELAEALRQEMRQAEVPSTWCVIYPGGYAPHFYKRLLSEGFEIALHFDALSGRGRTSWCYENLVRQRDWLIDMVGIERITTNKNHYTRWEGETEFSRWLEQAGIALDQTRGPSKRGNVGFLHGSCHPWFPMDEASHRNRFIDVLELPLHAQDLVVTCPVEFGRAIVDEAAARHGVAHLLFHPAHIRKPGVAEALHEVVGYGRARGLVWWTAARINAWERYRRRLRCEPDGRSAHAWRLTAPAPSPEPITLLYGPLPADKPLPSLRINGRTPPLGEFRYLGLRFARLTVGADDVEVGGVSPSA
ncbi:MAG TPA: hypothetical protein VF234_10610 [Limnochordia bacterium]